MPEEPTLPDPAGVVEPLDAWLNERSPAIDDAVEKLQIVRALAHQAAIAEAHIVNYLRERLDVDDLADDPDITREDLAEIDA